MARELHTKSGMSLKTINEDVAVIVDNFKQQASEVLNELNDT